MKQNAKPQAAILRKASEDRWQLRASQILLITLREADNQKWNQMGVWRKQAFTDVCQREEVFQEWPSSWSNRLYFQTVFELLEVFMFPTNSCLTSLILFLSSFLFSSVLVGHFIVYLHIFNSGFEDLKI